MRITETTECDPLLLVAEAVIAGTIEVVVDAIAETDEGIPIVPETVVARGSVAFAAAIAMAIRLYFIGSTCLAPPGCF